MLVRTFSPCSFACALVSHFVVLSCVQPGIQGHRAEVDDEVAKTSQQNGHGTPVASTASVRLPANDVVHTTEDCSQINVSVVSQAVSISTDLLPTKAAVAGPGKSLVSLHTVSKNTAFGSSIARFANRQHAGNRPPPADTASVSRVANQFDIPKGKRCASTLLPKSKQHDFIGCAIPGGCVCSWFQHCYPKYSADTEERLDVGVCQPAMAILVVVSIFLFLFALFSVVLARGLIHRWEAAKEIEDAQT